MHRCFINLKNRYYQKTLLRGLFSMSFPQGIVAWIPATSLRGGTSCRRGNPVKHIFILNLFSILIKPLITFGIAWIATATSWLRNDGFLLIFEPCNNTAAARNDVADTHTTMPRRNDTLEARITS